MFSALKKLSDTKTWFIFLIILTVGIYLRFYHIEAVQSFGWDQGRDLWVARDILQGKLTLLGPRTGVGHMHLGPLYYYFLAPFVFITHLDPMGSNNFNILANLVNFIIIFVVTKKIFNNYAALFVTLVYSLSHYLITINQVPWNVTLMPGIAALIFYSIVKIYDEDYRWVFGLWGLSGFYWNIHFTAVFMPFINILSLIFVKDRVKVIKYSLLSIPLYIVWLLPNIISAFISGGDTGLIKDFFKYYYIGFHLKFLMHRLPDALVQFQTILFYPLFKNLKFIIPGIFLILLVFEKDKRKKLLGYLISLWFVIPLLGFTTYGGPLSEYYFLYTAPMALFIFVYLQGKLLRVKFAPALLILIIFWSFYAYQNTKDLWIKPESSGLMSQKKEVKKIIRDGGKIEFNEGDIKSYLYVIWTKDKVTNK